MTLEMQRLYLKELMEEINNIDRIMNSDGDKVNDATMDIIVRFHRELVDGVRFVQECSQS